MGELSQFHYDVARAQLDFAMQSLREFTEATHGASRYRSGVIEPGNDAQKHTLGYSVQALSEWLDAYETGTAALAAWQEAVSQSIANGRSVDWAVFERDHAFDLEWQVAKLRAQVSIDKLTRGVV